MTEEEKQIVKEMVKSKGWKLLLGIFENEINRLGDETEIKVDGKSMEEIGFEFIANRKAKGIIQGVLRKIKNLEYKFNEKNNKWI